MHLHEQHLFEFQDLVCVGLLCDGVLLLRIRLFELRQPLVHLELVDLLLKFEVFDVLQLRRLRFMETLNALLNLLLQSGSPGV